MIECAEAVVFGSGRPVILLPCHIKAKGETALESVIIGWDGSRPASRAVADALPILEIAREVCVVTITNAETRDPDDTGAALVRNLSLHGVHVTRQNLECRGGETADVLQDFIAGRRCDLLVMGAFGHSRFREAIFGGTTRTLLERPPAPILIAH